MFKLRRPCKTCPFRIGVGSQFALHPERLEEIRNAPAFQCHGTVDYVSGPEDDNGFPKPQPGAKPQQCALLETLVEKVSSLDGATLHACNELGKMVQVTHERVEEVKKVVIDVMHRRRKWGDEPGQT